MQIRTVAAPAKINLTLDVLERLPNGYHRLAMIMQTIGLSDTIRLEQQADGISLACEDQRISGSRGTVGCLAGTAEACGSPDTDPIPLDAGNLAWRAAEAFFARLGDSAGAPDHRPHGVHIRLTKRIPSAAGLAGGSADAAAVLRGLNDMYGFPFAADELAAIGVRLGADVPYCLRGGTCLAEGIGELLTPLPSFAGHWLVLVKPPFPVPTPWVFGRLRLDDLGERPDTAAMCRLVAAGELAGVAAGMRNVLERVTEPVHPEITAIRECMRALGALGSRMSGSGPSVFGLFADEAAARKAQASLVAEWPACWVVPTVDG